MTIKASREYYEVLFKTALYIVEEEGSCVQKFYKLS